jgi:hypothetical protein
LERASENKNNDREFRLIAYQNLFKLLTLHHVSYMTRLLYIYELLLKASGLDKTRILLEFSIRNRDDHILWMIYF